MAFCTGCGASLDASAKFCTQCGTAVPAAVAPAAQATAAAAPAPAPITAQPVAAAPSGGSSALKIILIVILVIVGIGIIGAVSAGYFIYHAAQRAKSELRQGITVSSSQDATDVAQKLGVEVYPGAKSAGDAGAVSIGGFSTGAAHFTSDDAPEKVAEFYRKRYPRSKVNVSNSEEHQQVLVIAGQHAMVTITIEPEGSGSRITIASVSGIPTGAASGSDQSN